MHEPDDNRHERGAAIPMNGRAIRPSEISDSNKRRGVVRLPLKPADNDGSSVLPTIDMSAPLYQQVDESVSALASDPEVYQRDARLVRVVRVAEADAERERMTAGTPQIRPIALPTLRERLTRLARYQKLSARSGELMDVVPADRIVAAVDSRGEWPGVRPLLGVLETPSMRPDGSNVDSPGYDAATGFVYMPGCTYPPVTLLERALDEVQLGGAILVLAHDELRRPSGWNRRAVVAHGPGVARTYAARNRSA